MSDEREKGGKRQGNQVSNSIPRETSVTVGIASGPRYTQQQLQQLFEQQSKQQTQQQTQQKPIRTQQLQYTREDRKGPEFTSLAIYEQMKPGLLERLLAALRQEVAALTAPLVRTISAVWNKLAKHTSNAADMAAQPDLLISFDPAIPHDRINFVVDALTDYYRVSGGEGFKIVGPRIGN